MMSHEAVANNGTTHFYPTIDPCVILMIHLICSLLEQQVIIRGQEPINANPNRNNNECIDPSNNNTDHRNSKNNNVRSVHKCEIYNNDK